MNGQIESIDPSIAILCLYIGCLMVLLFCFGNFKDNISDGKHPSYYLILSFFCFVNVVFYILLCSFFLKEMPTKLIFNPNEIKFEPADLITILLASFMYFGIGSTTYKFPIMGIDINIYGMVFENFKNLIPQPSTEQIESKLQEYISNQNKDLELCDKISELRSHAPSKGWDLLNEVWKETNAESLFIQINCMREVEKKLTDQNPEELKNTIQLERVKLITSVGSRLTNYVKEFYIVNGKTENDRRDICTIIGLPETPLKKPNVFASSLVISFGTGFFIFGPVAAINKQEDIPTYSLIGAISVSVLGVFIPRIIKATQISQAIFNGLLAGILAHTTWLFLTKVLVNFVSKKAIDFPLWDTLHHTVVGGQIGVLISILLYLFKKNKTSIVNKIPNFYLRYTFFCLLSGIGFLIISVVNYPEFYLEDPTYLTHWFTTPLIGIGVGWMVAYVANIFEPRGIPS